MDTKFAGSAYRYFLIWGILASLAVTLCTIIDSFFIGNIIGSEGLAVANLSTPVFLLYALLGITIGVGANVQIGRMLGASDVKGANHIFHSQLALGLIIGILSLSPLLFKDAYFSFLGVTEELYPLANQYLTVVMWSAPIFVIYNILSISVRTDSNPMLSSIASGVVIITNLTLDLFFMKILNWGIIGASASLCIAETLGLLTLLTHFLKKHKLLKLRLALPKPREAGAFVYNGFGIGSANIFIAIVMRVFNGYLITHGGENSTLYVAIYGVIYTLSMIPAGVFEGTSNALTAVAAFFIGESDSDGIFTVMKKALTVTISVGILLTILCNIFAGPLVSFFGINDPEELIIAANALKVFSFSILFAGINTVITAFWQTIGRAKAAGIISITRNLVLLLIIGSIFIPRANILGLSFTLICTEVIIATLIIGSKLFAPSKRYVEDTINAKGKIFENNYPIQRESMAEIAEDLEKICEEWEIGVKQTFFINFICEELLLNIIKFGLNDRDRQKKNYYVSIKLIEKDGDYVLRIRDNVSLYNPFESHGDEIDSAVLNAIKKKTKFWDYQHKMIFNYLYLII